MATREKFSLSVVFDVLDKASKPVKKIGKEFSKLKTPIKKLTRQFRRLGNAAEKSIKGIGKGLKGLLPSLAVVKTAMTAALVAGTRAFFKASINFNKSMANVATLIPGNLTRIKELKKGVQDLAIDFGKDTQDLASGLYEVVSAFGDTEETMKRLRIVSKASTAGLADTADTLNLLSIITKEYGDTSAPAMLKASDLAFSAVKLGQTNFQALAQSMSSVVPIASQLKVKQEELFAVYAAFTRGAQTTPELTTEFGAALTALLKPSEELTKVLWNMGHKGSGVAALEARGFTGALEEIIKRSKGSKEALSKLFVEKRALRFMMKMSGPGMRDYNDKLEEIRKTVDMTNIAFKEQQEGINKTGAEWDKMIQKLKVAAQSLGDIIAPKIVSAFDYIYGFGERKEKEAKIVKAFRIGGILSEKERVQYSELRQRGGLIYSQYLDKLMKKISEFQQRQEQERLKWIESFRGRVYVGGIEIPELSGRNNKQLIEINVRTEKGVTASMEKVRTNGGKAKVKLKNETLLGPNFLGGAL